MNAAPKPLVEPWLRRLLRALVAAGFALVAANSCQRWWFFESRARDPNYGATDLLEGRLALVTVAALAAGGFALWELLGSLPRIGRRSLACIAAAVVLGAIPPLVAAWLAVRH